MTDPKLNLNPFVLPGMGQSGESASNPIFASMEMMRQAMSGLAQVGTLGVSPSLTPTINPEELERRIQELKVVEKTLQAVGISDWFDEVVTSDDVSEGKPAPEIFLRAASLLGVDPGRCLVVEDAPAGVMAAQRAGMQVLVVPSPLAANL